MYAAHQVVRLELVVLKGLVKVGQALVDDWQGGAADVEEKRPGDAVCMAVALPFASRASSPAGHYAVCATDCLILYIPHVRLQPLPGRPEHVADARVIIESSQHVHGIHTMS